MSAWDDLPDASSSEPDGERTDERAHEPPAESPDEPYRKRLLLTIDLFETGLVFKRFQIRQASPGITEDEVERRLTAWLQRRDEPGDGPGTEVPWPRR